MWKDADGVRTVKIPEGTEVQKGTTPGGESPTRNFQGSGGAKH